MLQKKNIGNIDNDLSLSESELEEVSIVSKNINVSTLVVFWQFILESIKELSIVSNQILSLEMVIMRLIHLKDMPSYQSVLDSIKKNNITENTDSEEIVIENKVVKEAEREDINNISKDQIKNTSQTKLKVENLKEEGEKNSNNEILHSFDELINLSSKKREIELKYDLERNVNLIKFSDGKIDIAFNEKLNKNFVRNLSEKLLEWTGKRWVISLTKEIGQKSFLEQRLIKKEELLNKVKKDDIYKNFTDTFLDAELIDVKKKD